MAARIDRATVETRTAEHVAGHANGLQLGMGGRIARREDFVDAGRDHLAILDQHRAERAPALADVLTRQFDGFAQEAFCVWHVGLLEIRSG